ncbi:MAG: FecR domain-containing protein [Candidatus Rifleibacteriota bacterium]
MSEEKCQNPWLIQEYLDAPEDKVLEAKFNEHIKICSECRTEFLKYKNMFQSLKTSMTPPKLQPTPAQMQKIREAVSTKVSPKNASGKPELNPGILNSLMAFLLQPAAVTALIILAALSAILVNINKDNHRHSNNDLTVMVERNLNFSENRVEIVFADPEIKIKADNLEQNLNETKSFDTGKDYELPPNSTIIVFSGSSKVKISESAKFRISSNGFDLFKGKAEFNLAGKHDNFRLNTPLGEVTPIGTEFTAKLSNNNLFIGLIKGKIAIKTVNGSVMQLDQKGQTCRIDQNGNFQEPEDPAPKSPELILNPNQTPSDQNNSHNQSGNSLENNY